LASAFSRMRRRGPTRSTSSFQAVGSTCEWQKTECGCSTRLNETQSGESPAVSSPPAHKQRLLLPLLFPLLPMLCAHLLARACTPTRAISCFSW
jgi:hypothetical protein